MQDIVRTVTKWNLKRLIKLFVITGVVLALVSSYLGYTRLYLNDERRFWYAIENSMSTPSVTRVLTTGGSGNQVVQSQQMFFEKEPKTISQVLFDQRGATTNTSVVTEGLSFLDEQYSRYTKFSTDQKRPDGAPVQIDDLLNKWEVLQSESDAEREQTRQNYINELVSLVIFGNFDADFKHDVATQLKEQNVYAIDLVNVTDTEIDGEPVKIYPISLGLQAFAGQATRAFTAAGYGDFPPLDPANFTPDNRIDATIAVNTRTNAVVSVSYFNRQEQYIGYGIHKEIDRPDATFSAGELESRVQEAVGNAF